ncbi:GH1 family beta-glucosidase [Aliagarivorans taiwanensis]|uniref:GH1 family beta-glucosidase n=1 Tax=Aliagarivorans taiwanensis TaxID=561966 RepID=UPI00041299BE|nr:GH1 family beta-glucosidase [Aliagarivorans taiwanensis]
MSFPEQFIWGAAAASYQIEGNTQGVDGCGDSVWDMCCRRDGFVKGGDTGFVACDHYNRFEEDVAIMKKMGLKAYRFSIMWPRVMPNGTGEVNEAGLAFYDKLIDTLLANDIEPWITLFHWDYPTALFHRGGWLNDESSDWFADYVRIVVERYSDRVKNWFTLNEPQCFIGLGHQDGNHAPGLQLAHGEINRAWHNTMLAHGKAVSILRNEAKLPAKVGAAPCFRTYVPASDKPEDIEAARQATFAVSEKHMFQASWFMDPITKGEYPADGMALYGDDAPVVSPGDMALICQELDFVGYNVYESATVRAGEDGKPELVDYPNDYPRTHFDWPVTPESLRWGSQFLYERYGKPIIVTENGLSTNDWVGVDGKVNDYGRIDFLTRYLRGLHQSIESGTEVLGYFQWSIMDNFEWAAGYSQRFGLVHIDYATQKRTMKQSAYWYGEQIASNGAQLIGKEAREYWPEVESYGSNIGR